VSLVDLAAARAIMASFRNTWLRAWTPESWHGSDHGSWASLNFRGFLVATLDSDSDSDARDIAWVLNRLPDVVELIERADTLAKAVELAGAEAEHRDGCYGGTDDAEPCTCGTRALGEALAAYLEKRSER
jgi:hypothetical protein